jgi:cyclic-di-GMP phosphodiesterase TipF (flagellum assembly factor)
MLGFIAPLAYGAIAVALMMATPNLLGERLGEQAPAAGVALGILVFLAGFLVQEMITRRAQVAALKKRLDAVVEQTLRLREEVRRLRDGQQAGPAGDSTEIDTVVAEMRMLKTLVQQMSGGSPAPAAARSSPSAQSGAPQPAARAAAPSVAPTATRPGAVGPTPRPAAPAAASYPPPMAEEFEPEPSFTAPPPAAGMEDTRSDEQIILDVVREALAEERLELSIQPIVSLPSRRLGLWECTATIRTPEGIEVQPETYMEIAERAGLSATINNMLLVRSVQFVRRMRRQKATIGYICPIVGETLRDRAFFADFLGFMQENRDLAGLLSFSITQQDVFKFDSRTDTDVTALGKLGFKFVLDQVSNLDLFISDLSAKGFRLVKVPAHMLLAKHGKVSDPRALKRSLDRGALDLMATGISSEDELVDVLDFAVDYGQGLLFGGPRPADRKPDIIDPR